MCRSLVGVPASVYAHGFRWCGLIHRGQGQFRAKFLCDRRAHHGRAWLSESACGRLTRLVRRGRAGLYEGTHGCPTRWIVCLHEAPEGFLDRLYLSVCRRLCRLACASFSHHRVHVRVDLVRVHFESAHPFGYLVELLFPTIN